MYQAVGVSRATGQIVFVAPPRIKKQRAYKDADRMRADGMDLIVRLRFVSQA